MFIIGRLKHLILLLLVVFVVVFFRWNGRVSLVESLVYWAGERVSRLTETTFLPYGDTERLKERLRDAEMENARLLRQLAGAEEEIRKLRLLSGAAGYYPGGAARGRVARIVERSPVSWHGEVVVDAGESDGVREGFIALAPDGLAGVVVRVTGSNSAVRLITGKGAAVSAVAGRGNAYGIVYGDGAGGLRMESLPSQVGVAESDRVFTSGLGGVYPPMLPVGRVSRVVRDEKSLSPAVEIAPAADINNLYYILLVEP